jgi:type IV pilus assembly PilW-like protein
VQGVPVVNRFHAKASGSTGEPELYCEGSGKPGSSQPLVEGVERLRLRYWPAGAPAALDASALAPHQWSSVVAVDVCVLVRGARDTVQSGYVDCDGLSSGRHGQACACGVLATCRDPEQQWRWNMMRCGPKPMRAVKRHTVRRGGRAPRRDSAPRTARRARNRGAALPVVLMLSSMMLATSAAWFETSVAAARGTANVHDQLVAFHAADSALTLCAQRVLAGDVRSAEPTAAVEPVAWKQPATFGAAAFAPVAKWHGSFEPPQCAIEAWRLAARPAAHAWLITAHGYGSTPDAQAWLQLQLVVDNGIVERHWRRVAARPF